MGKVRLDIDYYHNPHLTKPQYLEGVDFQFTSNAFICLSKPIGKGNYMMQVTTTVDDLKTYTLLHKEIKYNGSTYKIVGIEFHPTNKIFKGAKLGLLLESMVGTVHNVWSETDSDGTVHNYSSWTINGRVMTGDAGYARYCEMLEEEAKKFIDGTE